MCEAKIELSAWIIDIREGNGGIRREQPFSDGEVTEEDGWFLKKSAENFEEAVRVT